MSMVLALNWLDWVLIVIVAVFGLWGFAQGLLRGLLSLITWLIAVILAYFFADTVKTHYTVSWFDSHEVAYWVAFFAIVVAVVILGALVSILFSTFRKGSHSMLDRFLGFFFGLAKSILVMSLVIGILQYSQAVTSKAPWQSSQLVPWFVKASAWIDHKLPDDVHQEIHKNSLYQVPASNGTSQSSQYYGKSVDELSAIG